MVSVVICTRNRARLLGNLLETFARQTAPSDRFEVIVVDNASQDDTRAVTEKWAAERANIRYLHEAEIGLSPARNTGWRAAAGTYVAFMDDECRVPDGWIESLLDIIEERSPEAVGGGYGACYSTPKPDWFKDSYRSFDLCDEPRAMGDNEYLRGGNVCIRKDLLEELEGFGAEFGMQGNSVSYGEETDLQRRLLEKHPEALLLYHPVLDVLHEVRPEVMTLRFRAKSLFGYGSSMYNVFWMDDRPWSVGRILVVGLRSIFLFCVDVLRGFITRNPERFPHIQNYFYEYGFRHFRKWGYLAAVIRGFRKRRRAPVATCPAKGAA